MEEKQANTNTGNNTEKTIVEIDNKPVLPQKINKTTVEATLATPAYTHRITNFFGGNQKDALRFQASTLACINKNPKLAQCTPASFFDTLNKCAEFRLFPDGRTAALVPMGNSKIGKMECQFRLMAQGYIELFAQPAAEGISVDAGQHYIEQYEIVAAGQPGLEGRLTVGYYLGFKAVHFEVIAFKLGYLAVVLGDEYAFHIRTEPPLRTAGGSSA